MAFIRLSDSKIKKKIKNSRVTSQQHSLFYGHFPSWLTKPWMSLGRSCRSSAGSSDGRCWCLAPGAGLGLGLARPGAHGCASQSQLTSSPLSPASPRSPWKPWRPWEEGGKSRASTEQSPAPPTRAHPSPQQLLRAPNFPKFQMELFHFPPNPPEEAPKPRDIVWIPQGLLPGVWKRAGTKEADSWIEHSPGILELLSFPHHPPNFGPSRAQSTQV